MTQGLFDVLRLVGRLFLGSKIGGTGKAAKRDKSQSRKKDRKEAGTNDQAQQRKEEIMGSIVVGLLLLLVLAGIKSTATAVPILFDRSTGRLVKSK